MEKRDILLALIQTFSAGNKSKFAQSIGLPRQTISTWIERNTFDINLIYKTYPQLSAHWLLTGEGKMFKGNDKISLSELSALKEDLDEHVERTNMHVDEANKKIEELSKRSMEFIAKYEQLLVKYEELLEKVYGDKNK